MSKPTKLNKNKAELMKSTLFFDKADFKKLKIVAAKKDTSASEIIRQLVKEYLSKN